MLELWDADSGNIIGSYLTLDDLAQAACGWGQANPTLPAAFLVATKEYTEPIAPARGVFHGLLLSCHFWVVVGLIAIWVVTK